MNMIYGFDGRLNGTVIDLNATNMNYLLNSFSMTGKSWDWGVEPPMLAMGFITTKLMGVRHEGPEIRNPGLKWWQDPEAVVDTTKQVAHENRVTSRGKRTIKNGKKV